MFLLKLLGATLAAALLAAVLVVTKASDFPRARAWEEGFYAKGRSFSSLSLENLTEATENAETTVESSQPAELKKTKEPKPSARPHPPKATAAASKAPSTQKVEKPADAEPAGTGKETAVEIHVCFCSDDTDWRPLAAAINSTLTNSKRPKSLVFHLITSTELAPVVSRALITVLPVLGAQLQVHSDALVQKRIKSLISYRSSSGARKGLASAFNFAPFYLEDFLRDGGLPKRLIYLDTDVLLLGDIEALWKVDMKGLPAAAVEDCSQSFDIYIDFDEMEALGLKKTGLSKKDCVFNRGIFVMDVAKWKRMQITKEIEHWMAKYKESKKDLYKFGMSQPPWLLALHKKYHKLGEEWNCRGLGRETLSLKELKELKTELHLDFKALQKVGARAMGDQAQPYIASCSREAQILHFNGKLKPWRSHRWVRKKPAPMCMVHGKTFPTLEKKSVLDMSFVRCADIWSNFLSMPAAELLNSTAQQFYRARPDKRA